MRKKNREIQKKNYSRLEGSLLFIFLFFSVIFLSPFNTGAEDLRFKLTKMKDIGQKSDKIIDIQPRSKKIEIVPDEILIKFKEKNINLKKFSDRKIKNKESFSGSAEEKKIDKFAKNYKLSKRDLLANKTAY